MTQLKPAFLTLIGLLAFTAQAQVNDTIPTIMEVDSAAAYDEDMPMPVDAIEGYDVDYGDYPVAVTEAPDIEEPMVLFNEFNTKTIAKLEANPDKPARYPSGIGVMNTEIQENLSLPYNYTNRAKYVVIQVTVGKDSMLYNPKVMYTEGSEYTRNAKEAIQSLSKRFAPAMKAGKPVDSIILIPVRFETATKRTNFH